MKFHSTYIKMTLFYVLIVMTISVVFSVVLYNISSSEIDQGLGRGRQAGMFRDMSSSGDGTVSQQPLSFEDIRLQLLQESNDHLKLSLLYFNLLILLLSSGASYLLARKTLQPIEEAMEAQNRFTADASHELRTPLTAMKAEIEVNLRDKKLNLTDSKKLLQSNLEEISKLESLSNGLLKLARLDDGPIKKNELKMVSLPDILVEAYEKVESLAQKKMIKISFNESTGSETDHKGQDNFMIKGDQQSLAELFVILLDNAIKYSPTKSHIAINLKKHDKKAVVKIIDHGAGIKSSDLPYIFNRFYRADSSRSKERADGYGLGLSIAKTIVESHRGAISAESNPGKGSEFTVTFNI